MTEIRGTAHIGQPLGALKFVGHRDLVDRLLALEQLKTGFVTPAIAFPVEVVRVEERCHSR